MRNDFKTTLFKQKHPSWMLFVVLGVIAVLFVVVGIDGRPLATQTKKFLKTSPNSEQLMSSSNTKTTLETLTDGWQLIVGTEGRDQGTSLILDTSGMIYVAGSIFNGKNSDIWIGKYDTNGNEVWQHSYNGPGDRDDQAKGIVVDSFGGIYVVGYQTHEITERDVWISKYDANGNSIWTKTYDGPSGGNYDDDEGIGIAWDGAGALYIIGYEYTAPGDSNILILKYSLDGEKQWRRIFTTDAIIEATGEPWPGDDRGFDIAVSKEGMVYATGYEDHVFEGTWEHIWTAKLDSGGNLLWEKEYNSPDNDHDHGYGISIDDSENVFVAGRTLQIEADGAFHDNSFIRRYDPEGNTLWTEIFDTSSNLGERFLKIVLDGYQNPIAIGGREQIDLNPSDVWIRKYNSQRELVWNHVYDGPLHSSDVGTDIAVDGSGNIYAVGISYQRAGYGSDIWIRKYEDLDQDGFSNTTEQYLGTDLNRACPATTAANDEPIDPWPPDFNDNRIVGIDDIYFVSSRFNAKEGDASYTKRAEIASQDGVIGIDDVYAVSSRFGQTCTP